MSSSSSHSDVAKKLSETPKVTGLQVVSAHDVSPSMQQGISAGTVASFTLDEIQYLLSIPDANISESASSALVLEAKSDEEAKILKSLWDKVQVISYNAKIAEAARLSIQNLERSFLFAYPFDGKQVKILKEARDSFIGFLDKNKEKPGTRAVHEEFADVCTKKLKARSFAKMKECKLVHSLLAPLGKCINSEEIVYTNHPKESKEGWGVYLTRNEEDNTENNDYLLAVLTFKDVWHSAKLIEALKSSADFEVRSMFSNKKPAVAIQLKITDLESKLETMQASVETAVLKFRELLGRFAVGVGCSSLGSSGAK